MTQLFLKNETVTVKNGTTADSYGATGTKETLVVAAGATVTADQNIERIELSGASSAYTYSVAGNVVTIKLGTVAVATYTVANGDKTIAFADGSATLVFTKLDAVTLGGQAIATTSTALTGIMLNKTDVSASAPTIALTGATTVNEGDAITYTATLSSAAATAVTIPYTLSGTNVTTTDFTGQAALTGNITVAAGATTGTLTLNVAADATTEGVENLTVALSAASAVTTAIADTSISAPTIALTQSAATVNEGGTVTYTATLSSATTSALTIPYTLSGTGITPADFGLTALTGNISVAAGATTGTLILNVAADTTTEGVESLTVALAAATSTVVTTITDTSVAANAVTVNAVGTISATAAKDIFNVTLGNYTATINGFNAGDKIIGPSGVTPTLVQPSFTDGQVGLQYAANSQVAVIILTGLTNAQDGLMFQPSDLNNTGVFGTGSLA